MVQCMHMYMSLFDLPVSVLRAFDTVGTAGGGGTPSKGIYAQRPYTLNWHNVYLPVSMKYEELPFKCMLMVH